MLFRKKKAGAEGDQLQELKEKLETTRELYGWAFKVFAVVAIAMSLFQLYSAGVRMLPAMQHRAFHLSFALFLTFFLYPATPRGKGRVPWYDIMLALGSVVIGLYIYFEYWDLIYRIGNPTRLDIIMGIFAIFLIMEATRRTMGWPLVIVAGTFLLYALFGNLLPGGLGHRGYSVTRLVEHMYLTAEGIYGVAIYVTSTFVYTFVLLGAFLKETGGAQAFIDLAFAMAGKYRGGPAKAAVLGSGLMGMISGSSFANVAGTGTFTIPLMKSVGYKPHFAGGVEASASAGGQIMPPIMGAAAFIMAEMTGIHYGQLIMYAALPATLYFISVFIMVDFEAARQGLAGLPQEELPRLGETIKKGFFLLLAPASIIYFLVVGFTPIKASFYAVLVLLVGSSFRKDTRLNGTKIVNALINGAKGALPIIAACGVAGLIVGTVTLTGLGLKFAELIITIAGGHLYLALFLTMVASIIMGMGMPTTALYIILGTMVAPALVRLGVPVMAAHLFIFYFGCMAAVTPPVALSSYLAAAIARADAVKTAFQGLKLSLSAFLLPYIFAVSPTLLLVDTGPVQVVQVVFTSLCGIFALAASLQGYLMGDLGKGMRAILFVTALVLIAPEWTTDLVGVIIIAAISLYQYRKGASKKTAVVGIQE